jgi:Fe-S-cluster-containing dehydrogenase component
LISRRDILKLGAGSIAGAGMYLSSSGKLIAATEGGNNLRWAFMVDTLKCVGCGFCVKACKLENEIPYDSAVSRTWVERYVIKHDGQVIADSPKAGRDGFIKNDPQGIEVPEREIAKSFFVPKLCNQCAKPACVQVCPVGATYQAADGVVLVDRKWCIGCGYCIMACPYGVRFFHPKYKVAEKCNWCYHRIMNGMTTACVDACPFGARKIGNILDPNDPLTKIIKSERVGVLKEEYGTNPMAYYIGLDTLVR